MRFLSAAAAFLIMLAVTPALAAQSPFSVEGVAIDASASNTFEAQTAAMRQGQREAALQLIRRLALPEDLIVSPILELSDEEVAELISGIEVLDERRSPTRYLAQLNVSFDPRAVERLFGVYELAYVEAQARPALVLPILSGPQGGQLWGGHAWMQAWRGSDFSRSLTPFFAPPNESGASVLNAGQALAFEEAPLRALAQFYGAPRLAVVLARDLGPAGGGIAEGGPRRIEIVARIADFDRGPDMVTYDWGPVELVGDYAAAADAFVAEQANIWKRESIVRDAVRSELRVTVLYGALAEWRALQEVLAGASLVEDAQLDAMSRDGALMTLSYRGEQEQLRSELAARGAALEEHPGLGWVVRAAN